jgi:hypothetical protein
MLANKERSFVDLQVVKNRADIRHCNYDNKILEEFLREGRSDHLAVNEHVGPF